MLPDIPPEPPLVPPDTMISIQNMTADSLVSAREEEVNTLRYRALREEALKQGAQHALAERYKLINESLNSTYAAQLDRTYSFAPFIVENVLIPGVVQAENRFIKNGGTAITTIQASYTIDEPAKFVSVYPTWRNYLLHEYLPPRPPRQAMLPKDETERVIWKDAVEEGWSLGLRQAEDIFSDGLAELEKAMVTRQNYRNLEVLGMIEPFKINATENGVTFNGKTMNAGETLLEISMPTRFKGVDSWSPVFSSD